MREQSAEFLVLSTHGTSPADGGAGTLAMACARKASTSVLLVKEPHAGPFVSIVACVGFSATSRRALEAAVRFAVQDRAVLHVLHVFDAPWHRLHYRAPTPQASPDYQKQYRDGLRRQLEAFCEPYQDEMARLETRYAVFDFIGQSAGITEFTRQVAADLVVLGTRGRTRLRDLLLGSTAERVVREAPSSSEKLDTTGLLVFAHRRQGRYDLPRRASRRRDRCPVDQARGHGHRFRPRSAG